MPLLWAFVAPPNRLLSLCLKSVKNLYLSHRFFCKIRQIHSFFNVFRQNLQILCRNQASLGACQIRAVPAQSAPPGEKLTGSLTAMGVQIDIENGKVADNSFTFGGKLESFVGPVIFAVGGSVEGDTIQGIAHIANRDCVFKGTRES